MRRALLLPLLVAAVACTEDEPTELAPGTTGAGGEATAGPSSTGAGAGGASSSTSSSGVGGGGGTVVPDGKVPMFVAQGHLGMTVVSCDDGQTWTGYRSFGTEQHELVCGTGDDVACFSGACQYREGDGMCATSDSCDCDHHPGSGKGLAYGDGAFVATFGWGRPGVVLRSENGFDWAPVDSGNTWADVAAGDGIIALSARTPMISTDGGLTFTEGGDADHVPWNVRRLFYASDAGVWIQAASSGQNDKDILVSSDLLTWTAPSDLPADCAGVSELAEGGGAIVTRDADGYVCRSTDGGDTWTRIDLPNAPSTFSGPLWDGSQFLVWGTDGGSKVFTSPDGATWSAQDTNLGGERLTEVVRNPVSGVMVAARGQWQQWYENMRWYRSLDGVTWETLEPGAGVESHPVRELAFGYATPSEACPAPQ